MSADGASGRDAIGQAPDEALGPADAEPRSLLEQVAMPEGSRTVTLTSGRRYELSSEGDADLLVVRGRGGSVMLRVELTDRGPLLSFEGAELDLKATRRLTLESNEIAVRARDTLSFEAGGCMRERVGGDHHVSVVGAERVEAKSVELQADGGHFEVIAMNGIHLDSEHIGLNDKTALLPFEWTRAADDD